MAKKKGDRIEDLKTSMEKVWLAGLGALSQAEKQGDKLFKSLVKRGKKYEELLAVCRKTSDPEVARALGRFDVFDQIIALLQGGKPK